MQCIDECDTQVLFRHFLSNHQQKNTQAYFSLPQKRHSAHFATKKKKTLSRRTMDDVGVCRVRIYFFTRSVHFAKNIQNSHLSSWIVFPWFIFKQCQIKSDQRTTNPIQAVILLRKWQQMSGNWFAKQRISSLNKRPNKSQDDQFRCSDQFWGGIGVVKNILNAKIPSCQVTNVSTAFLLLLQPKWASMVPTVFKNDINASRSFTVHCFTDTISSYDLFTPSVHVLRSTSPYTAALPR